MVEESLQEIIETIEAALGIGLAVLAALLENVRMQLSNSYGYGYGVHQAPYSELPRHYQSEYLEER